jgi:hypothetical protein
MILRLFRLGAVGLAATVSTVSFCSTAAAQPGAGSFCSSYYHATGHVASSCLPHSAPPAVKATPNPRSPGPSPGSVNPFGSNPGDSPAPDLNNGFGNDPDPAATAAEIARQEAIAAAQLELLQRQQSALQMLQASSDVLSFANGVAGQDNSVAQADPNGQLFQGLIDSTGTQPSSDPFASLQPTDNQLFQQLIASTGSPAPSDVSSDVGQGALTDSGEPTDPGFADAWRHLAATVGDDLRADASSAVSGLVSQGESALVSAVGESLGLSPDAIALGKSLLAPAPPTDSNSVISGYVGAAIDPWRDSAKAVAAGLASYANQWAAAGTCNCDPFAGSLGDAALANAAGAAANYGLNAVQAAATNLIQQKYNQLTGGADDPVSNSALRLAPVVSAIGNPLAAITQLKQWMSGNVDQLTQYFQTQAGQLLGFSTGQ